MKQLLIIFLFAATQVSAQMPKHPPRSVTTSTGSITYATWNSSDKGSGITLSNSNMSFTGDGSSNSFSVRGDKFISGTQTAYFEADIQSGSASSITVGIATNAAALSGQPGDNDAFTWTLGNNGYAHNNGVGTYTGSSFTTQRLGFAIDMGAGTLRMYVANSLVQTYTGISGNIYIGGVAFFEGTKVITIYTNPASQLYSPPAGITAGS